MTCVRNRLAPLALILCAALAANASAADADSPLDFQMQSIDGEQVDLSQYKGKVVLIVNVASRCGLTPQYAGLQQLYEQYKDEGLVILAFPCNQFGGQEPGTAAQIKQFCSTRYDVSFPLFAKIEVNGDDAAPLYKYLTRQDVEPKGAGDVSWNFEKFLVDREGQLIARYRPQTKPDDEQLVTAIKKAL